MSTKQQLGLTAMAFIVLTLSVILAIFFPASIPPFSTSLAFLMVCASAGAIIVIADNRRPPDAYASTFNPSGFFAYSTRLYGYGTRRKQLGKMFDTDPKVDFSQQIPDMQIATTSPIGKLLTREATQLWHPGFFDSQVDDEIKRYIRFLLSERDTMFVGVGMLLSLPDAQRARVLENLLRVEPDTEPVYAGRIMTGGLVECSFYRITTGVVGEVGDTIDVSYFMVRSNNNYMTKMSPTSLDDWNEALASELVRFPFDIPQTEWVALCGNRYQRPAGDRPTFPKSLSRRMNAPPNPAKPPPREIAAAVAARVVPSAAPQQPGSSSTLPLPQVASAPGAPGRFGFRNKVQDVLMQMRKIGKFSTSAYDRNPRPLNGVIRGLRRVDNAILTLTDAECFYCIDNAREVRATIIEHNQADNTYTIKHRNVADAVEIETKVVVPRNKLRVNGYGYECLLDFRDEFRGAVGRALPQNPNLAGRQAYVTCSGPLQTINGVLLQDVPDPAAELPGIVKALVESYGVRGFYVLTSDAAKQNHVLHLVNSASMKYNELVQNHPVVVRVFTPTPSMLMINYLPAAIQSEQTERMTPDEIVFQLLPNNKERLVRYNANGSFTTLLGNASNTHQQTLERRPDERYPGQ